MLLTSVISNVNPDHLYLCIFRNRRWFYLFSNATMPRFGLGTRDVLIFDRAVKSHCLQDGTHNTGMDSIFIVFSGQQRVNRCQLILIQHRYGRETELLVAKEF